MSTFTVILPSWKRPTFLQKCLTSLIGQNYKGEFKIIVVLRESDVESIRLVESLRRKEMSRNCSIKIVFVHEPGFVFALKAGFDNAASDLVGFCDDDAIYPPFWLTKLERELRACNVGGAGGPIKESGIWQGKVEPNDISRISYFGKITYGVRKEPNFKNVVHVSTLPGANMAYKRNLLDSKVFDHDLDGPSYSPGNELAIGWGVRRKGFVLNYIPDCWIEHYSAPWVESDRANNEGKAEQYGHNFCYIYGRYANFFHFIAYWVKNRLCLAWYRWSTCGI